MAIRMQLRILKNRILAFLLCETFTQAVLKEDTRVKMPKANQETLMKILVPITPIAEQERIATTIFQLLSTLKRYKD